MDALSDLAFVVRSYRASDRVACRRLFVEGLVGGRIADGDTGSDIEQIDRYYLARPGNHFWVAELAGPARTDGYDGVAAGGDGAVAGGEVVGMVGVQQHAEGTGEVRRLRVDERFRRRGIGSALMERAALGFCQEQGCLRIILDTFMERGPAVRLFEKFHFRHGRTRRVGEKDLLYFYLDLYGKAGRGED